MGYLNPLGGESSMLRIVFGSLGCLMVAALATNAFAWEGEMAGLVQPIAVVQEKAESGDFVVVEGEVAEVRTGSGSTVIVIFKDSSGTLPLAVPNHLLRDLAGATAQGGAGPGGIVPTIGKSARVGGKWNHKHMDNDTWGIRVQRVEPIEP
jgi:hypothetical protein